MSEEYWVLHLVAIFGVLNNNDMEHLLLRMYERCEGRYFLC